MARPCFETPLDLWFNKKYLNLIINLILVVTQAPKMKSMGDAGGGLLMERWGKIEQASHLSRQASHHTLSQESTVK